jgi:hypothetical protein
MEGQGRNPEHIQQTTLHLCRKSLRCRGTRDSETKERGRLKKEVALLGRICITINVVGCLDDHIVGALLRHYSTKAATFLGFCFCFCRTGSDSSDDGGGCEKRK